MCMTYNHKGKPAYVRLCYRTNLKGWYVAAFLFSRTANHMPGSTVLSWARETKERAIKDQEEHENAKTQP